MIKNHDRSGWIGASDTSYVMGSWNTKTFEKWWLVKLGLRTNNFTNIQMQTGTALEHRILDYLGIRRRDRQIKRWLLRLRVNLDGETEDCIHEVKTYSGDAFKVSKAYWQQSQVEMYVTGKKLIINAYRVLPKDYDNWFLPIDGERLSEHPIPYDEEWIRTKYLPRVKYLAKCLRQRRFPDENPD